MTLNKCKMCGGDLVREGGFFLCDHCGSKWEVDRADDANAVDFANAWIAVREGDFQRATELFEELIVKKPESHEAYWGRAIARNGIIFVVDYNESKKVPTCNNIREESFDGCEDVQSAIKYAPLEIAEKYKKQAEQIEKIRLEWLEKARHEPKYDVFISYKESDLDRGEKRTQDSVAATELYSLLVEQGYKVFFSRVSLRDKVSEHYEPYIYNAIKTAKVMIVFGTRAEYFTSTWIKNEWHRFKLRLEKGEKHKNSLVVVYNSQTMTPNELPEVLKRRQCLDCTSMSFYDTLKKHIKRVIEENSEGVSLDKINIEGNRDYKKATEIPTNEVKTKEVGFGMVAETSIDEKQSLKLIESYLKVGEWEEARETVEDILFDNPNSAEAKWAGMLIENRVKNDSELKSSILASKHVNIGFIEEILNIAGGEYGKSRLKFFYDIALFLNKNDSLSLLKLITAYDFDERENEILKCLNDTVEDGLFEQFEYLVSILPSGDVDEYIKYHLRYAQKTTNEAKKIRCYNRVIEIDAGNVEALSNLLYLNLESDEKSLGECIKKLVALLSYAENGDEQIAKIIELLSKKALNEKQASFAKEILRYYKGSIADIAPQIVKLGYAALSGERFESAEYLFTLAINQKKELKEAYLGLCFAKIEAKNGDEITKCDKLLNDLPEFKKALTLLDEKYQQRLICKAREQTLAYNERKLSSLKEEKTRISKEISDRKYEQNEISRLKDKIKELKSAPPAIWIFIRRLIAFIVSLIPVGFFGVAVFLLCLEDCGFNAGGILMLPLSFFVFVFVGVLVDKISDDKDIIDNEGRTFFYPIFTLISIFSKIENCRENNRKEISELKAKIKELNKTKDETDARLDKEIAELNAALEAVKEEISTVEKKIAELKG